MLLDVILTLGFLIHGFLAGRKSSIWGIWGAPAAQKTMSKGGGLRAPPLGMVLGAAGAAQTPKFDDVRPAQKPCIENQSVSVDEIYNLSIGRFGPVSGQTWPVQAR